MLGGRGYKYTYINRWDNWYSMNKTLLLSWEKESSIGMNGMPLLPTRTGNLKIIVECYTDRFQYHRE